MPFLPPNQQRQSTEGKIASNKTNNQIESMVSSIYCALLSNSRLSGNPVLLAIGQKGRARVIKNKTEGRCPYLITMLYADKLTKLKCVEIGNHTASLFFDILKLKTYYIY